MKEEKPSFPIKSKTANRREGPVSLAKS